MDTATGTFGPFDVSTLREVVAHLDDFSEAEAIYVEDVAHLKRETLAIVTSDACGPGAAENELGFLSDVDDAREVISMVNARNESDFQELLDRIEEWGA
jgi:hypothetical protein